MEPRKTTASKLLRPEGLPPDLRSDETLARVLDRGTIEEWRTLYGLIAKGDDGSVQLQERIYQLLLQVPTTRPYVWLTVLTSLGYAIDWTSEPRQTEAETQV